MTPVAELKDYVLYQPQSSLRIGPFNQAIMPGNCYRITGECYDSASLLLKGLATLIYPAKGSYLFLGKRLNFSHYRHLLSTKTKIAYVAEDAGMISNQTVLHNLLLMKYYHENSLSAELLPETESLCRLFGIKEKLTLRPGMLTPQEFRIAVLIRELSKRFEMILIDRPENFIAENLLFPFLKILEKVIDNHKAVIFFSLSRHFIDNLSHLTIEMAEIQG